MTPNKKPAEGIVRSKIKNKMNASPVKKTGRNEEYDREAFLQQLVKLEDSEGAGQMIRDMIELKIDYVRPEAEASTKSSNILEDDEITTEDRQKLLLAGLRESLKAVPDSMIHLLSGWFRPGDCKRPSDQKPDWLDMDKFRRGQKFAQDHMFSIVYSEMIGVLALFSFDDGLKPLVISGKSGTPYTAFRRYLSTALRHRHWYTQDPWMTGSDAWKDIRIVRAMHAAVSQKLDVSTNKEIDAAATISEAWCPARKLLLKDFSETCEAPVLGQCPYLAGRNNPNRPKSINQIEMALVQWVLVGLVTLYPNSLGIHNANDEDIEAYCHLWRSIGYQLGMEDEYNLCRGTIKEIRQRNHDFLNTWVKPNFREISPVWEHMGRCLIAGMGALAPFFTYEAALLHFLEIIDLKMPRFYASLSYKDWIIYKLMSSLLYYGTKLPWITALSNTVVRIVLDRAEKFTPEDFEAIRIKLSHYGGNNIGTKVIKTL